MMMHCSTKLHQTIPKTPTSSLVDAYLQTIDRTENCNHTTLNWGEKKCSYMFSKNCRDDDIAQENPSPRTQAHSLTHCYATNELGLSETRGTEKLRVLGFKQSGHHEINLFHLPVKKILFRGCARAFFLKNYWRDFAQKAKS
jgi:hypothetical protein